MDVNNLLQLAVPLAFLGFGLAGFNRLIGRGPQGTIWILSACLFTWGAILPIVMADPDTGALPRAVDLASMLLRLAGAAGFVMGCLDRRGEDADAYPLCDWLLRQPLLWGTIVSANFYALLYQGTIHSPLLWRYTAGHPVEIVETAFFFVGLAMLVIRLLDLWAQLPALDRSVLPAVAAGTQNVDECDDLIRHMAQTPHRARPSYLRRRFHAALDFVRRKASADHLDEHLRYLEELDAAQMHASYATLRIIIWAIPILGFLGTVIGITVAIANLSPEALEQSMSDVTSGLGVAFDTTAQALALTMVLMFTKALVERIENRVLAGVDARVASELVGRFKTSVIEQDPNVAVVRRMSEQVLEAIGKLAARQAEVWKSSIDETHQQWADVSVATGQIVRDTLSCAIKESLEQHATVLAQNALKHADRLEAGASRHTERMTQGAQETVTRLREGLEQLGELLVEALERHGEVLTKSELQLAEENRQHLSEVEAALGKSVVMATDRQERLIQQSEDLLKEMQVALVEAAGATVRQQEQLVRQSDVLLKVVDATGQITRLEESLAENLAAVQRTHSFEEMAINLSAAIQLLTARLGVQPQTARLKEDAASQAA